MGSWRRGLRLRLAWLWNRGRPDKSRISFTLCFQELDAGATDEEVRRAYSAHFAAVMCTLLMELEAAPPAWPGGIDLEPALRWLASPQGDGFLLAVFAREGGADPATCVAVARTVMDEWPTPIPDNVRAGLEVIVRRMNRPVRVRPAPPIDRGPGRPAWTGLQAMDVVDAGGDFVHKGLIGELMAHTTGPLGPEMCDRFIQILRGLRGLSDIEFAAEFKRYAETHGCQLTTQRK